ncbi:MAG: histidine--tRNA ligase [Alphaproteobacteria bacterium]|nr:MAG: histidine--tRNA ligase [Alphaproteobacteria bacterium]
MSKKQKNFRPKARLPKGMVDTTAHDIRAMDRMITIIRDVYEAYGFEPLDTPALEYTDALGKFLPDADRPNEGVFSLQDEDEQWLSLRYDLTAPLARYVAQHFDTLPKPFRRYQTGPVWRNEKPGPGRFRQFTQFDADTVGASSPAADAEMCMLAADALEALGIARGDYVIRLNNRKLLDGVLESIGIDPHGQDQAGQRLTILRAVDKLDRLGREGVEQLLGAGRKDESGDYTKGAQLADAQIEAVLGYVSAGRSARGQTLEALEPLVRGSETGMNGLVELSRIDELLISAGFDSDRVIIDPAVVRGLEYYTGPVFEAELTFEAEDEEGRMTRFGSVGGGGRYDGLVARFKGQQIPATGFSIGVSRLYSALRHLGKLAEAAVPGPVVVSVFDKAALPDYQGLVTRLREAGIRAELYLGNGKMGQQFKYADQRGSPCVVIQGPDEKEKGEVQIKDLIEGAKAAREIDSNEEWREARPAQFAVAEEDLVEAVRDVLARHQD